MCFCVLRPSVKTKLSWGIKPQFSSSPGDMSIRAKNVIINFEVIEESNRPFFRFLSRLHDGRHYEQLKDGNTDAAEFITAQAWRRGMLSSFHIGRKTKHSL